MTDPRVENRDDLLAIGDREAREALIDVVESALAAVQPDRLIESRIERRDDAFVVDGVEYDLSGDVYLVGAGKGSAALAAAVRGVLGGRLSDGVVVEKRGQGFEIDGVEVVEAAHPVPDGVGAEAAARVLELAAAAGEGDLVIACITGGASALLAAPADGIALSELRTVNEAVLAAGAPIEELNAVRKHLSAIKGGRLAAAIHPARTLTLIVVDEVGGEPWGPTVPDATTYADAIGVLERHGLWEQAPSAIRGRLERGRDGGVEETPTGSAFRALDARAVVLADAGDVCEAAARRARELGYPPAILSTRIEDESREVGTCLAGIAKEVAADARPVEPPCVLVSGGETTVDVTGDGEGGPNQEFALGFALAIEGWDDVCAVAVGTDGTDGPTDVAGGLVDGATVRRARDRGVDVFERLGENDSATVLRAAGGAVYTGATGTNLMDLRAVLVEDTGNEESGREERGE